MVFTDGDNKLIPSEWFCLLLCGGRIEKMPGGGRKEVEDMGTVA